MSPDPKPRRAPFLAVLALFAAWVAALGYLAATSSEPPRSDAPVGSGSRR